MIEPIGNSAIDPGRRDAVTDANRPGAPGPAPILVRIEHRPLVLDAAMGTRLVSAGLDLRNDDPALWCLSHPERVAAIHDHDVAAGADAILTNTFGANRVWLARFNRVDRVEPINRRAVRLARSAAGPDRFVLGCVGPAAGQEHGAAAEQAAILVGEGVDALLFETYRFPAIEHVLAEVIDAMGKPVPYFVSLWEWPDPPEPAARRLFENGAAVLGLNCQPGANAALAFAERMRPAVPVPLLVKPGAGDRPEHAMSPSALAAAVPKLVDQNVRLIGGCCGTNEQHVAALAACPAFHRVSLGHSTGAKR